MLSARIIKCIYEKKEKTSESCFGIIYNVHRHANSTYSKVQKINEGIRYSNYLHFYGLRFWWLFDY